jgi:hypothetical protein
MVDRLCTPLHTTMPSQELLQSLGGKILWWHQIQPYQIPDAQPGDQLLLMLKTLLNKGLVSDEPTDGRHGSLFHYAAVMNWHNVCYLFVDHGADPSKHALTTTPLELFGQGYWNHHWIALPLDQETKRIHCDEMVRRRVVFVEQQQRNDRWKRRGPMIRVMSAHGFIEKQPCSVPAEFDTWKTLPSVSRKTKRENLDYLHGSIFANPLLREWIISFL